MVFGSGDNLGKQATAADENQHRNNNVKRVFHSRFHSSSECTLFVSRQPACSSHINMEEPRLSSSTISIVYAIVPSSQPRPIIRSLEWIGPRQWVPVGIQVFMAHGLRIVIRRRTWMFDKVCGKVAMA